MSLRVWSQGPWAFAGEQGKVSRSVPAEESSPLGAEDKILLTILLLLTSHKETKELMLFSCSIRARFTSDSFSHFSETCKIS